MELKAIDDVITLFKRQDVQNGNPPIENKKLGRKPSETLVKLKTDILKLIADKKKGVNRKSITSLLLHSDYNLPKEELDGQVSKATRKLSDDGKLVCIGGTSSANWYLSEWVEKGKVKNGFEANKKEQQLVAL